MRIFITGGCGYVGTVLTRELLKDGHDLVVLDTQWFGNYLEKHDNLKIIKGNVQDLSNIDLKGIESVIHLANIANDPGVELNQTLSWEVNALVSQQLAEKAIDAVSNNLFMQAQEVYMELKKKMRLLKIYL